MTNQEFTALFRSLYLPLGMYALRMVDEADIAEDLVEDAFIKVLEKIRSGVEIDNFKRYMYRAVRNECISFMRGKKEMLRLDGIPDVTDENVDTSIRDAHIWRAIDNLPDRCREVFLLSKRDGMSNEDIAEELGISVKTVKNQMTKAFSRLREALSTGHKPFFLPFL